MHDMIDMGMNLISFMLINDACDIVKHVTLTGNLILNWFQNGPSPSISIFKYVFEYGMPCSIRYI